LQRKSMGFTFHNNRKPTETASAAGNWTGHFWMAEWTLGFTHRNSRVRWELGSNWFHSFKVFTAEVDCFCPGSPSCWHWFGGQGCVWQVLLIGLHSMWGYQKQFLSSKLIYSLGGTCLYPPRQHVAVHKPGK
jgi:hypothetical protein